MIVPPPIYTFIINNIDYSKIYSEVRSSEIEETIGFLNRQSVYVPYLKNPLYNGDVFTLFGKKALNVFNIFKEEKNKVVHLLCETNNIPVIFDKNGLLVNSSRPIKSANFKELEQTIVNRFESPLLFKFKVLNKNKQLTQATLTVKDSVVDPVTDNAFEINLESKSITTLLISSEEKVYLDF